MQIAIVLGLVLVIFTAAAATVAWEDRRAARRAAVRRVARLARLGELDGRPSSTEPLSPREFDRLRRLHLDP
ncbi:MAG TPA: hypothetical protein VFG87_04170 [Amycolatopsis sp.]|nr:hypothetical protein [Amycolatopsis sp.]